VCWSLRKLHLLLWAGIDVNVRAKIDMNKVPRYISTAVSNCVFYDQVEHVRALLAHGANPYHAQEGMTLSHTAGSKMRHLIRSYTVCWNRCRAAAHALLAMRKVRRHQRDILYLVARRVWATRANCGWLPSDWPELK
jgi:hypothetical protein